MLIVAGRPRTDRVVRATTDRACHGAGRRVRPERLGLGGGGEDAPDRRQGEGAEADGTLEGGTHIVTLVVGDQGQQLLGLEFALDLLGEQAVEELHGDADRVR